jgi:hypothetical protein
MGVELFRDIEERWDRGMHGKEYEACDDYEKKAAWDTGAREGLKKVFEVRALFNDVTFIDEFLTPEFVSRRMMYTYDYSAAKSAYVISSREFQNIKKKLIFQLTNGGHPFIEVVDADFEDGANCCWRTAISAWIWTCASEKHAREPFPHLEKARQHRHPRPGSVDAFDLQREKRAFIPRSEPGGKPPHLDGVIRKWRMQSARPSA